MEGKKIEGSVPSQQPEANALFIDHYGSMKTQAVQEHNRAHNAKKHEKVENHSWAIMSTTKIIMIFKTRNVSKLLGRKGPLLGTYLVETVSCPLEAPPPRGPPPKKTTWWRPSHHPQNHPIHYPIPMLRSRYRTPDGALHCSPHSVLGVRRIPSFSLL